MGSGDRITFYRTGGFGLGAQVSRFPFFVTFSVNLFFWGFSVGFGKGYDE